MSGGRCLQVAVTSGPRATTWPMPLGDKPSHGARELTNKVRQRPLRRPHDCRRRSPHPRRPVAAEITAVALAGHHQLSGAPVDVVDRQGRHLARRDPSRASTVRIATSRRPVPLRRPHPRRPRAPHRGTPTRSEFGGGGALQDVGDTFVDTPTLLADSDVVTTPKLTT
jgi:hypothetical protein